MSDENKQSEVSDQPTADDWQKINQQLFEFTNTLIRFTPSLEQAGRGWLEFKKALEKAQAHPTT